MVKQREEYEILQGRRQLYRNFRTPIETYQAYFSSVQLDIIDFLYQRAKIMGSCVSLDVMGQGLISENNLPVTAQCAITLTDYRTTIQRYLDDANRLQLLTGSVLDANTWRQVEKFLHSHNLPGFDLVIFRPESAGFRAINLGNPPGEELGEQIEWWMFETISKYIQSGGIALLETNFTSSQRHLAPGEYQVTTGSAVDKYGRHYANVTKILRLR